MIGEVIQDAKKILPTLQPGYTEDSKASRVVAPK